MEYKNTNSSPSAPAHFLSVTKSVLVLRERNWYYHVNPARQNLFIWGMSRKFRLDISLDGLLVTIVVSHSFRASTNYTITMAPRMVSIDFGFS